MDNNNPIRVAVISAFPPVKDNYKGPNSLPYQLLKHRPDEIIVDLYYFSQPEITPEVIADSLSKLNLAAITQIDNDSYSNFDKIKKLISRFLFPNEINSLPGVLQSFLPPHKIINNIKNNNYDQIWLYPSWLYNWIKPLKLQPIIISGMDSASLHYTRCIDLNLANSDNELSHMKLLLKKYIHLEKEIAKTGKKVHMVGKSDADFFNKLTNSNQAFFVPHPHNGITKYVNKDFSVKAKLKILITGQADSIYLRNELDRVIKVFIENENVFKNHFNLNFIGSGFELVVKKLKDAGYEVTHNNWVADFSDEIGNMDIQIFPIAVGTGTKGKVLHALATGLLGIGTSMAFENINATEGNDFLVYRNEDDLKLFLLNLISESKSYSEIAGNGARQIRTHHSPDLNASQFWSEIKNNSN